MREEKREGPRKKRTFLKILLIIACLGIAQWAYLWPFQRPLAEKAYTEYRERQGIPEEEILEYDSHKYPKIDAWVIVVKYKSDPNRRYEYMFFRKSYYGTKVLGGKMTLTVFDSAMNSQTYDYLYTALPEDLGQ